MKEDFVYTHKVHYYETDRMGVTHHSNYIRFMEEARVAYLDAIGASYSRIEAEGVISPVIAVEGRYLHTTTFDDVIEIRVFVKSMTSFKLKLGYLMSCGGKEVFEGYSLHCFLDKAGKPLPLADNYPQFLEAAR
ncbi:MAG: acyl-CoA thioesterase [Bacteroidales bacterium]|nr:acyl-CoA thioesterase [Bacteroidales bacterium]